MYIYASGIDHILDRMGPAEALPARDRHSCNRRPRGQEGRLIVLMSMTHTTGTDRFGLC